jgi:hypothetical protein
VQVEPNEEQRRMAELWRERFGEPPPILTDVELMRSVLRDLSPRATPEPIG